MKMRLEAEYGKEKGERVLYASRNAGKAGFQNIDNRGPVKDSVKRRLAKHG